MATAIGVISGVLGIFQFLQSELPSQTQYDAKFRLSIANDGANGKQGPSNAGGDAPDVRIWGPTVEFLGITTNDNNYCEEGDTVCDFKVSNVKQAPDYALFTANDDAICITAMKTTYPDGDKYAAVIGNWAQECADNYGASVTWYYTSDTIKNGNNEEVNVKCAWIDANGDQPCTGIQVHWPDYNADTNDYKSENPGYFCNSHPRLYFHDNSNPDTVVYYTKKRFAAGESGLLSSSPSLPRDTLAAPTNRTGSSHQFSHKLVKSSLPDQTASELCSAVGAAGPSFVSYGERKFCHMPTKVIFPFCEDDLTVACWDDATDAVTSKIEGDVNVPALNFTSVATWTDFQPVK